MIAIDTNLVVRYLTGDNPEQAERARTLIDNEDVFVCITVLLETEWVLRTIYSFTASQMAAALRRFAGLPRVTVEEPDAATRALDWMAAGMDFADALHLAKAGGCSGFVTFDRKFARQANKLGGIRVRAL